MTQRAILPTTSKLSWTMSMQTAYSTSGRLDKEVRKFSPHTTKLRRASRRRAAYVNSMHSFNESESHLMGIAFGVFHLWLLWLSPVPFSSFGLFALDRDYLHEFDTLGDSPRESAPPAGVVLYTDHPADLWCHPIAHTNSDCGDPTTICRVSVAPPVSLPALWFSAFGFRAFRPSDFFFRRGFSPMVATLHSFALFICSSHATICWQLHYFVFWRFIALTLQSLSLSLLSFGFLTRD